jgi:hypothetical protein
MCTPYTGAGLWQDAPSVREFVRQAYCNILGRAPSDAEMSTWVAQVANQLITRQQLIQAFYSSPEYQQKHPQVMLRMDTSVPLFSPIGSNFQGIAARDLGSLGTGADGWDQTFAIPAGAIDSDQQALGTFDISIAAADFAEGTFYGTYHAGVDANLPGFESTGDALNGPVQDPGQVNGSPTITPPPSPPQTNQPPTPVIVTGGGNGGVGGPRGPRGDGCIEGDEYPWCAGVL